ncbi:MAG TPA: cell filamentation protein Fic [Clostridiales bacterium]|nr:cell filamentation protein Fic [Clostridiales bacterium]
MRSAAVRQPAQRGKRPESLWERPVNKLNIRDSSALFIAEREITALKIAKVKDKPIKGNFDLDHLREIHRFIFEDIYTWAGKLRTVNIAKGNQFCLCNVLEMYAAGMFKEISKENYMINHSFNIIPQRLAYYLSEINVLHPFREGNGRTQRLFIEYLASVGGVEVDFSEVTNREMIIASANSFAKEYGKMNALFERICTRTSDTAKENAVRGFFGIRSNQYKSIAFPGITNI